MAPIPPPPKIKAALATIKERYIDDNNNNNIGELSIQERWEGLYRVELLLRGIIVLPDDNNTNNTNKLLYDKINTSIGKSLINKDTDNNIPKPLLAGMNVIAGRLCEIISANLLLQQQQQESSTSTTPSRPMKEAMSVIDRANSIKDERWKVLLKAPSNTTQVDPLVLGQGYYTMAALIQVDIPPMWKKVWDLWNLRFGYDATDIYYDDDVVDDCPFVAQPSIQNMIRIATTKNNTKRVSELQLKLAQCYLNGCNSNNISNKTLLLSKKDTIELSKIFGDTLTPKLLLSLNNDDSKNHAQSAKMALEECNYDELTLADQFLYHIIQVQVYIAVEDSTIYKLAQIQFDKNQNRSLSSNNMEDCLKESRKQFFLADTNYSNDNDNNNNLLQAAITLRDTLLKTWPSSQRYNNNKTQNNEDDDDDNDDSISIPYYSWIRCIKVTKQIIERLMEWANAKKEVEEDEDYVSAWGDTVIMKFILPILIILKDTICQWNIIENQSRKERITNINSWLDNIVSVSSSSSSSEEEQSLATLLAVTLPFGYWMVLGGGSSSNSSYNDDNTTTMMTFIVDLLTALIHRPVPKSQEEEEQESAALGGGKSPDSKNKDKMNLARSAAVCYICQTSKEMMFHISRDAISRKRIHSNYLGVLQCLISWSGWYQRPWLHCPNLSDARRLLSVFKSKHLGRPLSSLESILIDLAYGDAESLLSGGVWDEAYRRYSDAHEKLIIAAAAEGGNKTVVDNVNYQLLQAHCNNGMARVCLLRRNDESDGSVGLAPVQEFAQKTIDSLQSLEIVHDSDNSDDDDDDDGTEGKSATTEQYSLHIWNTSDAFVSSRSYQLSVARHLIADSLVLEGRSEEARSFLEAAVHDAPLDAEAALALGAFLMRIHFYENNKEDEDGMTTSAATPEDIKSTQIQLLKAAKLDSTKASPFALLGLWFEEQGDLQRARGCYTKSLQLESSHPVAGRGMLRLESRENMKDYLDAAIHSNSSHNGWAWRATGLNKVFLDGEDDLAVVSLLKSLRCRDIANADNEQYSIFYDKPGSVKYRSNERADALAEVAMCYRRLGRYTAAIRAFHGAIEVAGDMAPSLVLCSCAQVELELALFDTAVEKFSMVLQREKEDVHAIAAYGQGTALLSIAQRDLQDGKAGLAYERVHQAIEACRNFSDTFGCTQKLLGDLYSFGASLPPNVFAGDDDGVLGVEKQLEFIAKGEEAYNVALDNRKSAGDSNNVEESIIAQAADLCDVANNILLQARILCSKYEKGVDFRVLDVVEVKEIYDKAAAAFQTSIELNPLHAPAWCGYGCSVVAKDPLLAQHSFCRCLQLEQLFPDAYSNLGFLYTSFAAFEASEGSMNALTQIADTPMMWMNRALVLELDAAAHVENQMPETAEREIVQAADAYRAALQVMKLPDAQLGLAITGRMVSDNKMEKSKTMAYLTQRKDSTSLMKEFMGSSCRMNAAASVIYGAMSIEQAIETEHAKWSEELVGEGKLFVKNGLDEKDLASFLDINSLDACLDGNGEETNHEENRHPFPDEVCLQRQILHTPDRPDLWLALCKELAVSLEADCPVNKISSAIAAAERACRMLEDSMVNSSRGSPIQPIEAGMFSEALALADFLKSLIAGRDEQKKSQESSFELQRALMMCPNNRLAREALTS